MTAKTFSDFADDLRDNPTSATAQPRDQGEPHLVVQILSVIAFGAFSIVGIALAFSAFWLAGLVLATIIAWTWAGSRMFGGPRNRSDTWAYCSINALAPSVSNRRSTGNSSFDAHRAEMMQRLEQESRDFEDFLTRLRKASDATEFDQFMDDRAAAAQDAETGAGARA